MHRGLVALAFLCFCSTAIATPPYQTTRMDAYGVVYDVTVTDSYGSVDMLQVRRAHISGGWVDVKVERSLTTPAVTKLNHSVPGTGYEWRSINAIVIADGLTRDLSPESGWSEEEEVYEYFTDSVTYRVELEERVQEGTDPITGQPTWSGWEPKAYEETVTSTRSTYTFTVIGEATL